MAICKNLTKEQVPFVMFLPTSVPAFCDIFNLFSAFQVDVAFSKFDISGDKKLDYKEFCDMINSREGQ